jgi:AhpD family alkylhydroperoxidase
VAPTERQTPAFEHSSPDSWRSRMPTKKTQMSRFHIHDDLTAPEASLPILKGLQSSAGQLPNFLGVLAGSAAALRGYVRFRAELTRGTLPQATRERIALAVAEHHRSKPGIALHNRTARRAGVGLDEIAAARAWASSNPQEAAMLRYLRPLAEQRGEHPTHLHEEAREAGWTDEQLLEAIALVSLESFTAMVNLAGEIPVDGSVEETRVLRAA